MKYCKVFKMYGEKIKGNKKKKENGKNDLKTNKNKEKPTLTLL